MDKTTVGTKACDYLRQGVREMQDREIAYDAPGGERSMRKTVAMFNAATGHKLSEEQGWKFMICLKLARSEQGIHKDDDYVDGAAYFGLAGEAASRLERIAIMPSAEALAYWDRQSVWP